jgi:hypothetical protein
MPYIYDANIQLFWNQLQKSYDFLGIDSKKVMFFFDIKLQLFYNFFQFAVPESTHYHLEIRSQKLEVNNSIPSFLLRNQK